MTAKMIIGNSDNNNGDQKDSDGDGDGDDGDRGVTFRWFPLTLRWKRKESVGGGEEIIIIIIIGEEWRWIHFTTKISSIAFTFAHHSIQTFPSIDITEQEEAVKQDYISRRQNQTR